jgi:hypothetical protein
MWVRIRAELLAAPSAFQALGRASFPGTRTRDSHGSNVLTSIDAVGTAHLFAAIKGEIRRRRCRAAMRYPRRGL